MGLAAGADLVDELADRLAVGRRADGRIRAVASATPDRRWAWPRCAHQWPSSVSPSRCVPSSRSTSTVSGRAGLPWETLLGSGLGASDPTSRARPMAPAAPTHFRPDQAMKPGVSPRARGGRGSGLAGRAAGVRSSVGRAPGPGGRGMRSRSPGRPARSTSSTTTAEWSRELSRTVAQPPGNTSYQVRMASPPSVGRRSNRLAAGTSAETWVAPSTSHEPAKRR